MNQDAELNALLNELNQPVKEELSKEDQNKQVKQIKQATQVIIQAQTDLPDKKDEIEEQRISILKDFDIVGAEILGTWRDDRRQTQEVIDILLGLLSSGTLGATGLESLVQALAVKANTSLTAVKLLDSKTRLLQAAKNQILVQNNIGGSNEELTALLNQPVEKDLD